ncbi:GlsB/YeaQ/YmgE family stress response membrane protein [Aciditerrimonas ferrireducens]|uniref:GlsB/YeaQ/YmgE family stress response membrane protein n=1 Tax=Aciditerrimonas ferrireducens TaxID=667306 RepID=UPI0020052B59|nr:hypothetical protein [Aciditerrimonas ferrireducens]MCK4176342.1 hypothetical protein [Aciditerrimonas ferrireducens]
MILAVLLSVVVSGLIVGGLGRLLVPGHSRMGIGATILIGFAGSVVGNIVGAILGVGPIIDFVLAVGAAAVIVAGTHGHRHFRQRRLPPGSGGSLGA